MSNAFPYILQIRMGTGVPDEHPLWQGELTLGRARDNDVILDDPKVSRHHLKLIVTPQMLLALDLGSHNGVQLNGQPLSPRAPTPFQPGDVLTAGAFAISLRPVSAQASAPALPAERLMFSTQPGLTLSAPQQFSKQLLDQPSLTIGRALDNELIVNYGRISAHHARIEQTPNGYMLTDLNSSNGSFYNGQRVASRLLADGDVIYLGGQDVAVQFRAYLGLMPAPAAPAATVQPVKPLDLRGKDLMKIGRASDNDVVLDHPQISRYHAQLERLGGRYRLTDLKSANGVFLNGKKVEKEAWPAEGDELRLGPYRLVFAEDGIQQLADEGVRLDVFGLQKWVRPDLNLLQDLYLSIYSQEFVALVGMSGAGKSTFMDAVNGFRPGTHGTVLVNGDNLYENFDMYRNDMGYVPQRDIVHKELTVHDALDYAAQLRMPADTSPAERERRVQEVMQDLGLDERQDVQISKISGGQLKRVSIGVELITQPRLFFLDEPTSGLDPGTEYTMMRLLRHLADQGRTIMLITHATKNMMLCDKVIILVRGGYLAYYGPPEEALTYFDRYRTDEERRVKAMEFDDIYNILEDKARGKPEQWAERYKAAEPYRKYVVERLQATQPPTEPAAPARPSQAALPGASVKRVSALRQLRILASRNLKIITQDKRGLLMMALMPVILGAMDLIWGLKLFDPVDGNPTRAVMMLFVTAVITMMAGALSSIYEIVKEADIYKRERAINLKLWPYVLSKVWVGILLALYQTTVLMLFKVLFVVRPGSLPAGDAAYLPFYVTVFLGILAGYMTGLAISASVPKAEQAMLILIIVVIAEIVFSGALLPLPDTPGHQIISPLLSNRWTVEAFINLTGIGDLLVADPCWGDREKEGAAGWNALLDASDAEKRAEGCTCMGSRSFETCAAFPGILNPDFYTADAQGALAEVEPARPERPTPYPQPTALPSPTPKPTATPASNAPPSDYPQCVAMLDESQETARTRCEEQIDAIQEQQEDYSDQRQTQLDEYTEQRNDQGDEYEAMMTGADGAGGWAQAKQDWTQNRQKAISSAEGLLKNIFESYGYAFQGDVYIRWAWIGGLSAALFGLIIIFQKRKDAVH